MRQITIELDDDSAAQLDAICAFYDETPSMVVTGTLRRLGDLMTHFHDEPQVQYDAERLRTTLDNAKARHHRG